MNDTAQEIKQVCDEIAALLIKKNNSYGDSAMNPIRVFSRQAPVEGIKIRIDDKLSRLKGGNGEFNEDTELDLLGYLVLLRVARKRGTQGDGAFVPPLMPDQNQEWDASKGPIPPPPRRKALCNEGSD